MKNNFDVTINKQKISCKVFSLEEYLKFLIARTSHDSTLIKQWMIDIIKTHTNMESMTKHDCELLIINLLIKSLHQYEVMKPIVCECGHEFDVEIKPQNIYVNYNDTSIEDLYQLQGLKLSLKWAELFDDDNITMMVVKAIESIYIDDDVIPISDLSEDEIDDLYSVITKDDIKNIKNILLSPKIQLDVPTVCPKCGKSHVHSIIGFDDFIRVLK